MTRVLDFSDGFTSASTPTAGTVQATQLKSFANDAAFVTNKGSAASAGDIYENSTDLTVRFHDGTSWFAIAKVNTATVDNTIARYDGTTGKIQSSTTSIDDSGNMIITGNLTVNGTTTTINTTTLDVADKNINVNDGGNDASSEGAGLNVERTGTHGSIIYATAATSKFKCGDAASEAEIATISHSQTLTNKTLTSPAINTPNLDGGTASNTSRITLSKETTANLNALTRKQANLFYNTTTSKLNFDDGSSLIEVNSGSSTSANNILGLINNAGITASVAANALTINLVTAAGATPSGGSSVDIQFRDATVTTGTPTTISVTSATTITIPSGATLGHSNSNNRYVYLYALNNAGTVELAVSSSNGFDELSTLNTTILDTASDSSTVIYSTTARTGVAVRLIGRILSNQATAGTWASSPTEITLFTRLGFFQTKEIVVTGSAASPNNFGSTNTRIRRFSTTESDTTGGDVTYTSSATNGDSFTINKRGLYIVTYSEQGAATDQTLGISINTTQLTTGINSLTNANEIFAMSSIAATTGSDKCSMSRMRLLEAGDVLRAHYQNAAPTMGSSNNAIKFNIMRVL